MTRITLIGGGSVQWTPALMTDMAPTETLAGAAPVLRDIDANALDPLARASRRIVYGIRLTTVDQRAEIDAPGVRDPATAASLPDELLEAHVEFES
jgi:alpha-galactosidase/6-phospho-beta-glucosidase family protein